MLQESECPLISGAQLSKAERNAGALTRPDLPKDMALPAELHCTVGGKAWRGARYVYTLRAAIERQVPDGKQLRWTPVAANTGFGTTAGSAAMLRQVHFTVRDLVRQEP